MDISVGKEKELRLIHPIPLCPKTETSKRDARPYFCSFSMNFNELRFKQEKGLGKRGKKVANREKCDSTFI